MNEMIARSLRSPVASRILRGFGIDPKRYWLLMDLFGKLSERREMLSQFGRDGVNLQMAAWLYFAMSGFFAIVFVLTARPLVNYFWIFQGVSGFLLLSVLLSETGNSLVNPVEGLVLAHQPIDGATYTAAKLSHLLRILLYLVPGMSAIPAVAGLALKGAPWFYPLLHMAVAFTVGLLLALTCCAVFGWLIRFVPAPRLKAAGEIAQMLPWIALMLFQFSGDQMRHISVPRWLTAQTSLLRYMAAALAVTAVVAVVLGLRSLSVDYLVRVSGMLHGRSSARSKVRRSRRADVVAWLFGGPGSRAGFEYVARMIVRDYQFRRQMIPAIVGLVMPFAIVVEGWRISPFSGRFTALHVLPHAFGVILFMICSVMVYGNDYKGAWVFLLAPGGTFGPFARGAYAWLWLNLVVIPHLALLLLLGWSWGFRDAALFLTYSLAVASTYLGLELRMIDGLPFGKPAENRSSAFMGVMFLGGAVIAMTVGLQYFLVFHSRAMVVAATLVVGTGACFATRASLRAFEVAIRFHLGILSTESKGVYQEVEG